MRITWLFNPLLVGSLCGIASAQSVAPFTSEATARGISYQMQNYPATLGYYGFGCGFADFDTDGDPDIVILGKASGQVGIYENNGLGVFTNRSATCGIANLANPSGFCAADFDQDGDVDLFLTQTGLSGCKLYNFNSGFIFSDVTAASGISSNRITKGCSAGDYDGDGFIDIYLCSYTAIGQPELRRNELWRNLGNGTFESVAGALGLDSLGDSLQSVWTDYDRDGDLDLYISNDRGPVAGNAPNQLFRNDGGAFVDAGAATGADVRMYSMGLACGDFSGDGFTDFFCTNTTDIVPPLNAEFPLMLSQPEGNFVLAQQEWGVSHPSATWGWGAMFFDWNNDGDLDLHVCNQFSPDSLFDNPGAPPAINVAAAAGLEGTTGASYSAAVADVDSDGDLDVLSNNLSATARLFINHEGDSRHSLVLRVISSAIGSDADAIGASASVTAGSLTQWIENHAGGNGYLGQNDSRLHLGLGTALTAKSAQVSWPSGGAVRTFTNLPADNIWTVWPPEKLGDASGNGMRDSDDLLAMCAAMGQSVASGMERLDFTGDFIIDGSDLAAFHASAPRPGDIDSDGVVGGADLSSLLGGWGSNECAFDLDGDGIVGGADLALMLGNWG